MKYSVLILLGTLSVCIAQQYTTPVPILKQINRHNEDGSYSYGYEAADGTFKIETKYPDGEVFGKYGYVDESGKLREVEYGASRRGFEPAGSGINVPPPTLKSNSNNNNNYVAPLGPEQEDDGQYREDPSVYYKDEKYNQPAYQQSSYRTSSFQQPSYQQPSYQQPSYQQPSYQQQSYQQPSYKQPAYNPPAFRPQPSYNFAPATSYNPAPAVYNWRGSPASNVDLNSGSYSVNY